MKTNKKEVIDVYELQHKVGVYADDNPERIQSAKDLLFELLEQRKRISTLFLHEFKTERARQIALYTIQTLNDEIKKVLGL